MKMTKSLLPLLLLWAFAGNVLADGFRVVTKVESSFADAKELLELAITGKGYVISHFSDIGEMLARTATDVGATEAIYGQAGVIEFCSATLSREMMAEDPANIIFCPYAIGLYQLAGDEEHVYVAYERLSQVAGVPEGSALARAEAVLAEIVAEATEF